MQLCKVKGAHDWILYDYVIPGVWKTNSLGDDRSFSYGIRSVAEFLQQLDLEVRAKNYTLAQSKKMAAQGPSYAEVVEQKNDVVEALEGSLVVVDDEDISPVVAASVKKTVKSKKVAK